MADRILKHLCDYALKLSYRDLPQEVIRRTKHIVLDTVGCALGGGGSTAAKERAAALAPVLAVVDTKHGDGKDVILGMVLGYEVLCGLIDAGANEHGGIWDQSTYGVIAAAVAAAKLFGHTREQMANAISLA